MPPRRRTFYLADATLLSNPKILRLRRQHPDEWVTVIGAFHLLIGVATLNGSPKLAQNDISDVLGGRDDLIELLREAGLMTPTGIDRATFNDWCPKPRPQYPSDRNRSGGKGADSGGVGPDSGGVGAESRGIPTSSSSSASSSKTASPSRGAGPRSVGPNGPTAVDTNLPAFLQVVNES